MNLVCQNTGNLICSRENLQFDRENTRTLKIKLE